MGLLAFEGSIRKEAGSKERNGRRIWQSPSLAVGIHNVFIRGLDLEHLTTQQEFERVKTYLSGQGIAATSYSTSSALVSAILGVNKKSSNEKEAKTASYISGVLASDSLLLSVQILSQPSFWPKCLEYMEKTKTLMASAGIKNRALVFGKIKQGLDLLPEETKRTSEVYNRLRSQLDEDTAAEGPFERVESVINTIFNGNKDEFRIIQKFYSRAQALLSPKNLSEEAKKNYRSPHISTPTPSCNPHEQSTSAMKKGPRVVLVYIMYIGDEILPS